MKLGHTLLFILGSSMLTGCYYMPRSIDSYNSTFRSGPVEPNKGDPYTFGGIADGSGGTLTRTSYSTDSKSVDPRSATDSGKVGMTDSQRIVSFDPDTDPHVVPKGESAGRPGGHAPTIEPQKGTDMSPQPVRG